MAIKISGTTVIDDSRNANVGVITATSFVGSGTQLTGVGIGTTGNISTTGNINAGIATFTRLDVPPKPITFSPTNGATGVAVASNIIITFDQQVYKGTGNITLRSGSAGGTAFSTIAVSSGTVTISGGAVTIDPPSNIGSGVTAFVVVDAGAFSGITTTSLNALLNTYSFTAASDLRGTAYEGGTLICCASPIRWVVSNSTSQVSRNWYSRGDASTRAQAVSGCTGWFVPTAAQLQNPGAVCKVWWDGLTGQTHYWSNTECSGYSGAFVDITPGSTTSFPKGNSMFVRAFRCVTY